MARKSPILVIKLHPDGHEVARYEAVATGEECPDGWFAVRATWVKQTVSPHGLMFKTGDTLFEYFSPEAWFNVFRVESPRGKIRGWYANVTYPAAVGRAGDLTTVTWHDLYLDVVRFADGRAILCDEDELDESGVAARDPDLHARIIETAGRMVALAKAGAFPFHNPRFCP